MELEKNYLKKRLKKKDVNVNDTILIVLLYFIIYII